MKNINHLAFAIGLVILSVAVPAAAQTVSRNPGYRIGPKDLVQIQVYEVPELNVERRVSEDGKINLPLIGDVAALGLTETELADRLKTLLESRYVQRASTSVEVREFRSKPIAVIGAVKQPGNLAFSGRWTLIEALTAAGGLAENHGNLIYVLRRADNGLSDQIAVDATDLLVRADPRVNLPIFASDLINVPATVEVTIYCLGEIAHPGAIIFKSTERITLLATIARAGGLTDRAGSRITIKRTAGSGGAKGQEITVEYKRILAGKDPDVELKEGDVVVVKESFF
ncbi:MAG TPA: polysaccharide biosynthesis/export family protein [Thermoanaerobaculia bacterium]|nr:polysaccharide biosynthesis/export family protein [Thermoanaerobaculia bacterium]